MGCVLGWILERRLPGKFGGLFYFPQTCELPIRRAQQKLEDMKIKNFNLSPIVV